MNCIGGWGGRGLAAGIQKARMNPVELIVPSERSAVRAGALAPALYFTWEVALRTAALPIHAGWR